jgi:hypothetical protein
MMRMWLGGKGANAVAGRRDLVCALSISGITCLHLAFA